MKTQEANKYTGGSYSQFASKDREIGMQTKYEKYFFIFIFKINNFLQIFV